MEPLVAVYVAAMQPRPLMLAGREAILEWHAANPCFRALAALTPTARLAGNTVAGGRPESPIVGFAYGFRGQPGE
jgi:hypothetical protein